MLEGWYCRTLANEQAGQQEELKEPVNDDETCTDDSQDLEQATGKEDVNYKTQYRYLKKKFKYLIYENEFFQDALRSNQRRLLKVSKDRAFLLDRLLQYEKPASTSSDDEDTESSADEAAKEPKNRRKTDPPTDSGSARGRRKKVSGITHLEIAARDVLRLGKPLLQNNQVDSQHQNRLAIAEVERHLQNKVPIMELMPERTPMTVPTEMFSNEPSLDSESNEHMMDGSSSPSHVAAEECVPMQYN